jgi:hypothetical protein
MLEARNSIETRDFWRSNHCLVHALSKADTEATLNGRWLSKRLTHLLSHCSVLAERAGCLRLERQRTPQEAIRRQISAEGPLRNSETRCLRYLSTTMKEDGRR